MSKMPYIMCDAFCASIPVCASSAFVRLAYTIGLSLWFFNTLCPQERRVVTVCVSQQPSHSAGHYIYRNILSFCYCVCVCKVRSWHVLIGLMVRVDEGVIRDGL